MVVVVVLLFFVVGALVVAAAVVFILVVVFVVASCSWLLIVLCCLLLALVVLVMGWINDQWLRQRTWHYKQNWLQLAELWIEHRPGAPWLWAQTKLLLNCHGNAASRHCSWNHSHETVDIWTKINLAHEHSTRCAAAHSFRELPMAFSFALKGPNNKEKPVQRHMESVWWRPRRCNASCPHLGITILPKACKRSKSKSDASCQSHVCNGIQPLGFQGCWQRFSTSFADMRRRSCAEAN